MAPPAEELPHPFFRPPRPGAVPLISPHSLAQLLAGSEPPCLVDVRSARERAIGHLPLDRHVPLEALPSALAELPRDRTVVTYDQVGYRARRAAEFLRARGFDRVAALEGGLDEYAREVDPSFPRYSVDGPADHLLLRQLPRPEGCLGYFLGDVEEGAALIVDPGRDVEPYRRLLADGRWRLAGIVETHTHADHLAGHAELHARTGAPILLSHRSPAQYPHERLAEGDSVEFGAEALGVLETPGHTRDHLALRVRDRLFTGDTLLIGSCGRTDLGDGSSELLWESLTEKILRLPAETEVYPAHFGALHALPDRYVSTLGFERASNEALTQPTREAFLAYMREGWPPKPEDFERIVRANLSE